MLAAQPRDIEHRSKLSGCPLLYLAFILAAQSSSILASDTGVATLVLAAIIISLQAMMIIFFVLAYIAYRRHLRRSRRIAPEVVLF